MTEEGIASPSDENMPEILLAEDNPADVYLVREALAEHKVKATVLAVSNGQEVLQILEKLGQTGEPRRLGLIILDLNLPRHDGLEILERLRKIEGLPQVPVVVLTSSDSPKDRLLATQMGASRFLRKPSGLDQFLSLGAVFKSLLEQPNAKSEGI
jgi:two-component system, chemotaxis family, response regulator Rcp1